MTAVEYRFQVIACWRVAGIERFIADGTEYQGRHHKPHNEARPAVQG